VIALVAAVLLLVVLGSTLALAEASISRMTSVRAMALREEGYRNAATLEEIENHPARYLNAVYLTVMFAQNGSAILVAFLAGYYVDDLGITLVSIAFTLAYFVVVEAMSKTFAILHSDRVALLLAPFVWFLGRTLSWPTSALIGLANVLLPGKGLEQGPFFPEHEIRSLADKGHEEGVIDEHEKELIHSVFQFGDRIARDIMVPRPDIVAIEIGSPLGQTADLIVSHGCSRIPVYRGDLDHIEGIVHVKDVLQAIQQGRRDVALGEILRPVRFVPESKRLAELLGEMQQGKSHLAIVSDEYGSVSGMVTLEDLLEELVGQIRDEHDLEPPDVTPLGDGRYRVNAALPIIELNQVLETDLPHEQWNTIGGLVFGLVGAIPAEGAAVDVDNFRFTVEKVQGRRILTVLAAQLPARPAVDRESSLKTPPS
jgi:CBS domain containing-hemolysin-like protein